MARFSVLDLSPIVEGSSAGDALRNSLDLARQAERLGFTRYWVAEHHNMKGIASAATAVVICHLAGGTLSIRVGAGGVMLPNHAPLMIAEQFGTLAALFPGRIDLGLGRAPGTDQITSQALRRSLTGQVEDFPQDVLELQHYLGKAQEGQQVVATPGEDSQVPLWILGSSLFGAQLAAVLGLPFAFASHFAPDLMMQALDIYRKRFKPSETCPKPYVMLGFNVCGARTAEEAEFLRSSSLLSFLSLRRGVPRQLPPPVRNLMETLEPVDLALLKRMQVPAAVGDQKLVAESLSEFLGRTEADELMLVSSIYDHSLRVRSYEIAAAAALSIGMIGAS